MRITGNTYTAEVTSAERLKVEASAHSPARLANEIGNAYSVLVDVTSASTDDDFFYLKNTNSKDLVITKIEGWCDDASQEVKVLLGATDAGTDAGDALTPVSLNAGITGAANVDCTQDATDLAITGGSVVDLLKLHATVLTINTWEYPQGLILPEGTRMHMEAALAGLMNFNIFFHFAE